MLNNNNIDTIATLGGHSALEICLGAKRNNFKTLLILQRGREKTYIQYYKNLVDEFILVDNFNELTSDKVIEILKKKNCIFIPHRYCQVYCSLDKIEHNFSIPIFGNKYLLKYEEREGKCNQYEILKNAGVEMPKQYKDPKEIDTLVIVKVREKVRGYERAFFFAKSFTDYKKKAANFIGSGKITKSDLEKAVIEEYLVGPQVNFNFFYSSILQRLELLGTDARRQTNIDGLIRIPVDEQRKLIAYIEPSYIETGHFAVTVKESLLEKAFEMGEKIVNYLKRHLPPGIIGPFALQTAVTAGPPKEKVILYDLSLRMPGSPGASFTPYSQYLFGKSVSFGERIAMEIKKAIKLNKLSKVTT